MSNMLYGVSAFALAMAFTSNAYAQDAQPEGAPDAATGGASTAFDADNPNVVIVTANRRAQDVQDVQIAVTAVDAVALERQGVDNIQEVTQVATSFSSSQAQTSSGSVVLRIRGIGTTSNNIGFESAVGIFIDGAYQSRPGVALSEFVDVERIEVLRGPQGTLFGRNTSAGALNIVNNRPDLNEFEGFANASYGNFDEISVQGAVNVPIVEDALAFRLTGAYRQRDGFITLVDGNGTPFDDSNDVDQYLVRGQIGFGSDGGLNGRIIADFSNSTSSCCSPIELYQSPLVSGGAFAAVGLGATGGNGQPTVSDNPFDQASFERSINDRIASANFAPVSDVDNYGVTGEVELPLGENADLVFIGSYRKYESFELYDSDFSALDIFNVAGDLDLETITAEIRLQGDAVDGRLNYVIGGYFSDEQIDQSVDFVLGEDFGELVGALLFPATGGALGPNPLTVFTGVDPAGTSSTNRFQQDAKSYSIFTHNSLELFDGFEVTLGARYSFEEKQGSFNQTASDNNICPAVVGGVTGGTVPGALVPAFIGLGCFGFTAPADLPEAAFLPLVRTFDTEFDDEELIYTAKIGYAFDVPVNVYASFTHGYKAGGINLDTTAAVAGADPTFLSEEVDAYEIGIKSRLLDNRVTLNVAAFHEEFDDFQVLEFTGTAFQTFNVPEAITTGVEIETLIRASDNLTVTGGLTVIDARYPDDCNGGSTNVIVVSLCGNELTNAPDIVGIMGATYEKDLSANLDFFISAQARIESDQRTSTQAIVPPTQAAFDAGGQAVIDNAPLIIGDVQDGNIFVNLRAGIGSIDDRFQIEAYANNLTNEVTRGVTFNTTLRGSGAANSRSAFSLQPRTYGVTVRTRF
ncbi:MAG: TonB-dependent receptor [Pontixanthobacter sp.]